MRSSLGPSIGRSLRLFLVNAAAVSSGEIMYQDCCKIIAIQPHPVSLVGASSVGEYLWGLGRCIVDWE